MSNVTKGVIAVIAAFVLIIIGVYVLIDAIVKVQKPVYAFEMNDCIAATANINEYRNSAESTGYPVGKIKAITEDGYAVLIFIPDLNFYGTATIPFSKEAEFQSVHCPEALGGDEI
jgi:hypothetical protein